MDLLNKCALRTRGWGWGCSLALYKLCTWTYVRDNEFKWNEKGRPSLPSLTHAVGSAQLSPWHRSADFLNAVYFRRGLTCTLVLTNDLIDGGQPRAKPRLRIAKPNYVLKSVFSSSVGRRLPSRWLTQEYTLHLVLKVICVYKVGPTCWEQFIECRATFVCFQILSQRSSQSI